MAVVVAFALVVAGVAAAASRLDAVVAVEIVAQEQKGEHDAELLVP